MCFLQEKLLSNVCIKACSASECACHIGQSQDKGGKSHLPLWSSPCPFHQPHQLNVQPVILVFHCGFGCSKDAVLQSSHWRPVMLQYVSQPHPKFLNKTKPIQNYSNKNNTFWINANKCTQIYTCILKFSIRIKFGWEKMEPNSNLSIKHIYPSQSN